MAEAKTRATAAVSNVQWGSLGLTGVNGSD
jgi:hypothetical protein